MLSYLAALAIIPVSNVGISYPSNPTHLLRRCGKLRSSKLSASGGGPCAVGSKLKAVCELWPGTYTLTPKRYVYIAKWVLKLHLYCYCQYRTIQHCLHKLCEWLGLNFTPIWKFGGTLVGRFCRDLQLKDDVSIFYFNREIFNLMQFKLFPLGEFIIHNFFL